MRKVYQKKYNYAFFNENRILCFVSVRLASFFDAILILGGRLYSMRPDLILWKWPHSMRPELIMWLIKKTNCLLVYNYWVKLWYWVKIEQKLSTLVKKGHLWSKVAKNMNLNNFVSAMSPKTYDEEYVFFTELHSSINY